MSVALWLAGVSAWLLLWATLLGNLLLTSNLAPHCAASATPFSLFDHGDSNP